MAIRDVVRPDALPDGGNIADGDKLIADRASRLYRVNPPQGAGPQPIVDNSREIMTIVRGGTVQVGKGQVAQLLDDGTAGFNAADDAGAWRDPPLGIVLDADETNYTLLIRGFLYINSWQQLGNVNCHTRRRCLIWDQTKEYGFGVGASYSSCDDPAGYNFSWFFDSYSAIPIGFFRGANPANRFHHRYYIDMTGVALFFDRFYMLESAEPDEDRRNADLADNIGTDRLIEPF